MKITQFTKKFNKSKCRNPYKTDVTNVILTLTYFDRYVKFWQKCSVQKSISLNRKRKIAVETALQREVCVSLKKKNQCQLDSCVKRFWSDFRLLFFRKIMLIFVNTNWYSISSWLFAYSFTMEDVLDEVVSSEDLQVSTLAMFYVTHLLRCLRSLLWFFNPFCSAEVRESIPWATPPGKSDAQGAVWIRMVPGAQQIPHRYQKGLIRLS